MNYLHTIVLVAAIISSILFIFTSSLILVKNSSNRTLSLLNSFPCEYFMEMNQKKRISCFILLIAIQFFQAVCLFISIYYLRSVYSLFCALIAAVGSLVFVIGFISPLSRTILHISAIICSFFMLLFFNTLLAFINVVPNSYDIAFSSFSMPYYVSCGTIAILIFISLCNPKLFNWSRMEKTEQDGKTIYIKPKVNYLALYEWIYFLLYQVSCIIVSVNFLLNIKVI